MGKNFNLSDYYKDLEPMWHTFQANTIDVKYEVEQ